MTTPPASYTLADAYALHVACPAYFALPDPQQIRGLRPGDFAKLTFIPADPGAVAERMWVRVAEVRVAEVRDSCTFAGTLANDAAMLPLRHGAAVEFSAAHIFDVQRADAAKVNP